MKTFKRILVAAVAIVALALPSAAQFSIGPRVGMNVSSMRFDKSIFDSDNRAGYNAGLEVEFMIPMVNVGFDASVMYVHRVNSTTVKPGSDADMNDMVNSENYRKKDYIEVPINFKWKIGLPVVGSIISPYLFTGPSFAFLTSKRAITNAYKNKSFDAAWNFGVGLQLFRKLQIGASYGLGMTKALEAVSDVNGVNIDGKNNYWTVTAAWLF